MGGLSHSTVTYSKGEEFLFAGEISPTNGGGFCSIRSPNLDLDVSEFCSIGIEVQGDGKRYALRLFSYSQFDTYAYEVRWQTSSSDWGQFTFPLNELAPKWRGREVTNAPPLNKAHITSIGFLIADKQFGTFSLRVRRVWFE